MFLKVDYTENIINSFIHAMLPAAPPCHRQVNIILETVDVFGPSSRNSTTTGLLPLYMPFWALVMPAALKLKTFTGIQVRPAGLYIDLQYGFGADIVQSFFMPETQGFKFVPCYNIEPVEWSQ